MTRVTLVLMISSLLKATYVVTCICPYFSDAACYDRQVGPAFASAVLRTSTSRHRFSRTSIFPQRRSSLRMTAATGGQRQESEKSARKAASNDKKIKLGFVGAGMMATAIINGVLASKVVQAENIIVSAPSQATLDRLAPLGVCTTQINSEVASRSDVIVLAVKPAIIPVVVEGIGPYLNDRSLIVSVAAGIPLSVLEQLVPGDRRMIRVMPNTPCLISEGACGFSLGSHATHEDREVVLRLLSAVGYACEVKEPLLDAVTGVSGSGPAYIFILIEALADGGVRMGLPRALALKLAAQTVKGAASMVLETGEHPAVLKDQVCSPGGLTIAAVESLEKDGFRAAAMSAVITVGSKSIEMRNAESS